MEIIFHDLKRNSRKTRPDNKTVSVENRSSLPLSLIKNLISDTIKTACLPDSITGDRGIRISISDGDKCKGFVHDGIYLDDYGKYIMHITLPKPSRLGFYFYWNTSYHYLDLTDSCLNFSQRIYRLFVHEFSHIYDRFHPCLPRTCKMPQYQNRRPKWDTRPEEQRAMLVEKTHYYLSDIIDDLAGWLFDQYVDNLDHFPESIRKG